MSQKSLLLNQVQLSNMCWRGTKGNRNDQKGSFAPKKVSISQHITARKLQIKQQLPLCAAWSSEFSHSLGQKH